MVATTETTDDPFLNVTNATEAASKFIDLEEITGSDCAWILSNAFLILTMQSGFGLLEAGFVSTKNIANIMVKNVVDVCMGGISYWAFGYGLSFGKPSNWFCGWGDFFATSQDYASMGTFYTKYVFQFSFATAATTIVSGAIAERMKLSAYMVFSVLNTFVYVFPASWAWNGTGFLAKMGFHDFAGACVVHMTGGASALVCAKMLGPRLGRFGEGGKERYCMSSPVTGLTGTFMLWWAWLAFNCGSTFGVDNDLWKLAAKAGINTLNGSIGGGIAGIALSLIMTKGRVYDVSIIITGILAGLVGVTAGCSVFSPLVSLIMGFLACCVAVAIIPLMEWAKIDDPVGAVSVHLGSAAFSVLGVGLFGSDPHFGLLVDSNGNPRKGIFVGGNFELLGVQCLGIAVIGIWSFVLTFFVFGGLMITMGVRMSPEHEVMGADWCEHDTKQLTFLEKFETAIARNMESSGSDKMEVDKLIQTMIDQLLEMAKRDEQGLRHMPHHMTNNVVGQEQQIHHAIHTLSMQQDMSQPTALSIIEKPDVAETMDRENG